MRLYPISPIFAARLRSKTGKISKKFMFEIIDVHGSNIDSLIVLGNGDVDDQVIPIICHHLNGSKVVGITKPEGQTRINVLKNIPTYVSNLKIKTIVEIMDQEEDTLERIYNQIERHLQDMNIRFELVRNINRARKYECRFGSRTFNFILVISGVESLASEKHNIEDHLIQAAIESSKLDISMENARIDSKKIWRSFSKENQYEILSEILNRKSLAQKILPQHFEGLKFLE